MLLTLPSTNDPAMGAIALGERAPSRAAAPRVRGGGSRSSCRRPAFLVVAMAVPQRFHRPEPTPPALRLPTTSRPRVAELKQQELVTPEEEQRLEEAIERIREGAEKRVDAASWEAADALREQVVASSRKAGRGEVGQGESARYAGRAGGGRAMHGRGGGRQTAELTQALEKLAQSGLLAGAPAELSACSRADGFRPTRRCAKLSALRKYLGETNGRFGELAGLGKEFGRFNPADFPLDSGDGSRPGRRRPSRTRRHQSRPRRRASSPGARSRSPLDRFKADTAAARRRAQSRRLGAARGSCRRAAGVADLSTRVGGPAVRGRRRPDARGAVRWRRGIRAR